MRLLRSLNVQVSAALMVMLLVSVAVVGFTIYELDLRKHDYVILNLTGQLSGIAQGMVRQSIAYRSGNPEDSPASAKVYLDTLRSYTERYNLIISSLQQRTLSPELTGRNDPLRCNWDADSREQLEYTASVWRDFFDRSGIAKAQGAGDAIAIADYIVSNEQRLLHTSQELSSAFQRMMEGKMALIMDINRAALVMTFVIAALLLLLLYYTFSRPLRTTLQGFRRIGGGDFGYQVPVTTRNEIGEMASAFNRLSSRLNAIFGLTREIDRAKNLDQMLHYIFEEFARLLPLDWIGLLNFSPERQAFVLERVYSNVSTGPMEGSAYSAAGSLLLRAAESGQPLHIDSLLEQAQKGDVAEFARNLSEQGYGSALLYPLQPEQPWGMVLAFASRKERAYDNDHLELLRNIAGQVAQGFAKTVVAERLVVSALTGLAKLAESRDMETGDHLKRMALYSGLIADELYRDSPYSDRLDPSAVRDIELFAPMHDIGKVGIDDAILRKPGKLDSEEWQAMQQHTLIGGEVLRNSEAQISAVGHSVFRIGIEIAEGHHERYDGNGYPRGRRGQEIPLSARIVAAADVFDALTSRRPYKEAWSVEEALAHMENESGKHFDPVVLEALRRVLPRIMPIYEQLKHI